MAQYSIQTDQYLNTNRSIYDVVMIAGENGMAANVGNPTPVYFGDSPSVTAFGQARVALNRLLADYRYMYGSGTSILMNDYKVGNGTITVDYTRVCCLQNVSTSNGDIAIRQTKEYHPYIPGTTNLGIMTFVFNPPKANLIQCVGMYDDYNGIFLRMNQTIPEIVVRKNGIDSEVVPQSQWNMDKYDGSYAVENTNDNPSRVNLDFTKTQILQIDYQWLGVGRVRVGFNVNGTLRYAHQFRHANITTEPYMFQPSLPIRSEIRNIGTTSSNSSLMSICSAVYCEGGDYPAGFARAISTDGTVITADNGTLVNGKCALAIKLKNTVVGKQVRAIAQLQNWAVFSNNDAHYKIVVLDDETYLTSPVWTNVPGYSWCQAANNVTMASGWGSNNNYAVLQDGFVAGAVGVGSGTNIVTAINNLTASIYQNYNSTQSQVLAIIVYKLKTDADVKASVTWNEIK